MNKTLTTAATLTLGARSYESPAITAVEIFSEGVMCNSTLDGNTLSVDEWETDNTFSW